MRTYLLFTLIIITAYYTNAQTVYPTGSSGCIARWNFTNSGTVTSIPDVSSNGNNGTPYNISTATAFRSIPNKAMGFNGSTSYGLVPHVSMLTPAAITMVGMFYLDTFTTTTCQGIHIFSKGWPEATPGMYGIGITDNIYDQSCATYTPTHQQPFSLLGNVAVSYTAGNYIQLRKWYFFASTFNGSSVKSYQVLMDTSTYSSSLSPIYSQTGITNSIGANTSNITIGKFQHPSYPYWLNGRLDEVILFNRALSDSEVHQVYHYLWGDIFVTTNDTMLCGTNTLNVNYTILNPDHYLPGNVFTVQLSNASGSFASPVNIGSVTSTTSGTIVCTIPTGTSYGSGYRIRVTSSDRPMISTTDNGKNIVYGPQAVSVTAGNDTAFCIGDSVTLTATGTSGSTYLWNTASTNSSIVVKTAGTYIVKATATYCYKYDTVVVTLSPNPALTLGNDTSICQGVTLNLQNLSHNSSYTYLWNNSSTNISLPVSTSGTYWVRAKYLACYSRDTINVTVVPTPPVNLGNDTTICSGNITSLFNKAPATSGASYLWNTTSTSSSITASVAGTYWLKITANGCFGTDTMALTVLPTPNILLGNDTTICQGNSILLQNHGSSGSYTYLWNNGNTNPTITTSTSGTYWLRAIANICSDTDTIVVNINPTPVVNLGNDTTICSNASVSLSNLAGNPPGSSLLWNTSATSGVINTTIPGKYWLYVNLNQCSNTDTINITHIPIPNVFIGNDTNICAQTNLTLQNINAAAGYTNLWSTGSTAGSINLNTSGKYALRVDYNGCYNTDTINIGITALPVVQLGNDTAFCTGTSLNLKNIATTPSGANYLWSTGSTATNINVSIVGTYWLAVNNDNCTGVDTINIFEKPNPVVILANDTTICENDNILLQSNTQPIGSTYRWNTGSNNSSITASGKGMYSLTVAKDGCTGSDSIHIYTTPKPFIDLGDDQLLCYDEILSLPKDFTTGISYSFLWSNGSTDTALTVTKEGKYTVTLTNICGTASDTVNVAFHLCSIWFPTGFSPNGDGRNDRAKLVGDIKNVSAYKLVIYNRWGENVYMTTDVTEGWDGTYKGKPAELGTYYYIFRVTYRGKEEIMKGDIILVR